MLPLTCNRPTRHQPHWCIQGKADSQIMQTLKLHLCAEKKKFLSHHMLDTCVFSPFWRVSESISVAKNVPFSSQVPVTQYCLYDTDFLIEAEITPDQTPKIKVSQQEPRVRVTQWMLELWEVCQVGIGATKETVSASTTTRGKKRENALASPFVNLPLVFPIRFPKPNWSWLSQEPRKSHLQC